MVLPFQFLHLVTTFLLSSLIASQQVFNNNPNNFNPNNFNPNNFNPDFNPNNPKPNLPQGGVYSSNFKAISQYQGNLVPYGSVAGDLFIEDNQRSSGMTIRLPGYFPFYGGRYNYTMISPNGFISFAYFTDDGGRDFKVGPEETNWPNEGDPALIAPYMCRQRVDASSGTQSFISYRVESRQMQTSPFMSADGSNRRQCSGKPAYHRCDFQSEQFLDAMQKALQEGVAGASTFRAEAALIVTWKGMRTNIGNEMSMSTYQLVWLTDAAGLLSYTIINYDRLGYDAADINGNNRIGRCQALFNGGNHTGLVNVDLSEQTKHQPSTLAVRSAVPHAVRGRYFHRVDDVVRPAGCSNKTGGTYPLLVYPNIVTMLGETTVEVNGLCLNPTVTYVLMIEQRESAPCTILNPSIARCTLPKVLDWGTKTVYFQPQSGMANDEKAYIGYIYFVPPTIDPMRLDIGDLHSYFVNPPPQQITIKWFPRNFTTHRTYSSNGQSPMIIDFSDPSIYNLQLGLYIVGYKEAQDEDKRKFVPQHRVLGRVTTLANSAEEQFRWEPQVASISMNHMDEWYMDKWERRNELFTYRFGYFKLAPLVTGVATTEGGETVLHVNSLPDGLVSSPVPLHWMWTLAPDGEYNADKNDGNAKDKFVRDKAKEMCRSWFEEDGALDNFVRETESNSSCPCRAEQAKADLGRFMPHPRCSTLFRDVTCTETLGSMNCFMSAQSVQGSRLRHTPQGDAQSTYNTHYGQTCCYDAAGYLMQSSYQPVLKIDESTPYSPGFPTRSYEFGTTPFQGMFEIPGLSSFHHDILPYYLCCKFTDFRCQMFYWRRPSSACQAYEPPSIGTLSGAGLISTLTGQNLIFNEPGVYTFLHAHRTDSTPEVQIQVRTERFPDRSVDFSSLNIAQQDLVQPTNTTVLTGVVLSADDTDRVHVVLRKDTRRGRYRTSIIVGNVIRYFDTMHLQRFKGVTVYVNTVERGQAEIYVVLDHAQIGVRIRESYAMDIDRLAHFESLGLLDIEISVPHQYNVNPFHDASHKRARVEGLVLPYPEQTIRDFHDGGTVAWSNVNNEGIRQKMLTYRVSGESSFSTNTQMTTEDIVDLFEARSDSEKLFQAYADYYLKKPVYTMSTKYQQSVPFVPQTEQLVRTFLDFCKRPFNSFDSPSHLVNSHKRCPKDAVYLEQRCNNEVACIYDSLLLQESVLGSRSSTFLHSFVDERGHVMRHYNSCGAMNIEYPEYLVKGPNSASPAYLEGDKLSFSCYQTHIVKGDSEFTCERLPLTEWERKDLNVFDSIDSYRMQWTQGGQPWCRPRTWQNTFNWLIAVFVVCGIVLLFVCIFSIFWMVKQKGRERRSISRSEKSVAKDMEMVPLDEKSIGSRYERDSMIKQPIPTPRSMTPSSQQHKGFIKGPASNVPSSSPMTRMRPSSSNPAIYDRDIPPVSTEWSTHSTPQGSLRRPSYSQLIPAVPGANEIQV